MKCRILFLIFVLIVFQIPAESFSESNDSSNSMKKGLYLCDGLWSTEECKNPESVLPYKKRSSTDIQKQSLGGRSDTEYLHHHQGQFHQRQFHGGGTIMQDPYFPPSSQRDIKTRLRFSNPHPVYDNGSCYEPPSLSEGIVSIRNVGEVIARDVYVLITSPGGRVFKARGPREIPPKAEYEYIARINEHVGPKKKMSVKVNCLNCYR
jgi:hypothetical protein